MKVAYVGGYWSTNIGNAFFNMGADYVLKSIFGAKNVNMIFDQPAGILRSKKKYGNPKRSLNLVEHTDIDILVLLGPVISKDFLAIWEKTIISNSNKNRKYMILSCGLMKYRERDMAQVKEFFKKYPPLLITTRDSFAFESLKGCTTNIYDGIDFAFFVPDAHNPVKLDFGKLLTLNFDKFFEPRINIGDIKTRTCNFIFEDRCWNLKFNNILARIGSKTDRFTDSLVYFLSVFPAKDRNKKIDQYNIVRTDHRFSPLLKNKVFRYSNSFVSDIPQSYLDIYAASSITLSDRVHACAVTLAYGNYAMLFSKTGRSKLLDRVGADHIDKQPVRIDLVKLQHEKSALVNWIKKILKTECDNFV